MVLSVRDELVRADEGLVNARIFADPAIYAAEREQVFGQAWLHVAHESEIPHPGDFVTRTMGEDPVIVVRGRDGHVRVALNVCRHRGRRLCTEDFGNAGHFQCGYHGWTYTNQGELTGVPFFEDYGGRLDKSEFGLFEVPHVDTYRGLIFASRQPDVPDLETYLGGMRWMLDLTLGRTSAVEVVGPPMRWMVDANWKLGAGNFAGDGHHLAITHGFPVALGLKPTRSNRRAYAVQMENGHVGSVASFSQVGVDLKYLALPEVLWPEIERGLDPTQVELLRGSQLIAGNVFPNFSFLNTASHAPGEWGGPENMPISFLTFRQWQPRGPDKMEVWTWLYMDQTAPEWWKEASRTCYLRVFGAAGMFEQDDLENWAEINEGLRGPMGQELWLHYGMGLDDQPTDEWPGPGTAYLHHHTLGEINERAFYQEWLRLMRP
jgi:nitrite reductase/ring-hydroxylating ferredoxin subunit